MDPMDNQMHWESPSANPPPNKNHRVHLKILGLWASRYPKIAHVSKGVIYPFQSIWWFGYPCSFSGSVVFLEGCCNIKFTVFFFVTCVTTKAGIFLNIKFSDQQICTVLNGKRVIWSDPQITRLATPRMAYTTCVFLHMIEPMVLKNLKTSQLWFEEAYRYDGSSISHTILLVDRGQMIWINHICKCLGVLPC